VAVALLVVLAGLSTRLFVWPAEGMPFRVDAIVMLAGPGNRLPVALRLAREKRAPLLVVSEGWQGYGGPCPQAVPGVKLVCFDPNPGDTRGEAEFAGRLAHEDHWSSMVLVTTKEQDARARILFRPPLRRDDLRDDGIRAVEQLALRNRLSVGSAPQGAGPIPKLLAPRPAAPRRRTLLVCGGRVRAV
jgi:hypothetical protein